MFFLLQSIWNFERGVLGIMRNVFNACKEYRIASRRSYKGFHLLVISSNGLLRESKKERKGKEALHESMYSIRFIYQIHTN